MFDGFSPEALEGSCRFGDYLNLEKKFSCRFAADSAMSNCGPNLRLLLAATSGALFLAPDPKAVAPARAGVLYDVDQQYRAAR
jgi:hypothetical protein